MEEQLIRITPNREKASSIFKMAETTAEMISHIDKKKFPSNIIKEYYEVIRELISIILLLDGYKAFGEGAHKRQIEYLEANYKSFSKSEIAFLDELRTIRNKIAYDGFFVKEEYASRKLAGILKIIDKLKSAASRKT